MTPMDHIVACLKRDPKMSYADVKAGADKKKLKIFPIMFGRAQLTLGIVKRGAGKTKRAAVAGGSPIKRGPGRPRKIESAGAIDLSGILSAVKGAANESQRYRSALEKIQGVLADALAG